MGAHVVVVNVVRFIDGANDGVGGVCDSGGGCVDCAVCLIVCDVKSVRP